MKKFLVIGNPIEHSLSPILHSYWIKKNNIDAVYSKKKLDVSDLENLIKEVKEKKIHGINVTVPFKNSVIPFLDDLSSEAKQTNSVNTICTEGGKIIGHNTDIAGFELALRYINYDVKRKKALIIGAGGVSPSIILALKKMECENIYLTNRTFEKAEKIKETFNDITIQKWGDIPEFDIVVNATSVGLNNESFDLKLNKVGNNKFFYDVIYNPSETNFLKNAKLNGNKTENGRMMFIYQAHQSFALWNKVLPKIDEETINILK